MTVSDNGKLFESNKHNAIPPSCLRGGQYS